MKPPMANLPMSVAYTVLELYAHSFKTGYKDVCSAFRTSSIGAIADQLIDPRLTLMIKNKSFDLVVIRNSSYRRLIFSSKVGEYNLIWADCFAQEYIKPFLSGVRSPEPDFLKNRFVTFTSPKNNQGLGLDPPSTCRTVHAIIDKYNSVLPIQHIEHATINLNTQQKEDTIMAKNTTLAQLIQNGFTKETLLVQHPKPWTVSGDQIMDAFDRLVDPRLLAHLQSVENLMGAFGFKAEVTEHKDGDVTIKLV